MRLLAIVLALVVSSAPLYQAAGQGNIVASLKFNPKTDGFAFENYGNEDRRWQDDLGTEDLIRMFGPKAVCRTGDNARNCVVKAAAREWLTQQLEGMDGGHCEGMAVASLRFLRGLPFKSRISPANFQAGAANPFALKLDPVLENYIAYYFTTQAFEEVAEPSRATAEKGPVAIAKMLIESINAGKDTYSLGFYKYDFKTGRTWDGHAVTPIAVEDLPNQYRIHIYDNNYPGETRYVVIEKAGKQTWRYVGATNPNQKADEYIGNIDSKTLELTLTGHRDGRCFAAPFASDAVQDRGCGIETIAPARPATPETRPPTPAPKPVTPEIKPATPAQPVTVAPKPAPTSVPPPVIRGETAVFALNGDGEMMIVDDKDRRTGYDPDEDRFFNEIPGAKTDKIVGGLGRDLPIYKLPYRADGEPFSVVFSGKHLNRESVFDFIYSAPGFTVGFEDIRVDPGEFLIASIAPNGEVLGFTSSADGEAPAVYFAFDSDDDDGASYIVELEGGTLDAGKTVVATFDFDEGKLYFSDDDGNEDAFDIELLRILPDGTEQTFRQKGFRAGSKDKFMMDFGDWDGKGSMCFQNDDDGDGFADEECIEEDSEDPGGSGRMFGTDLFRYAGLGNR
jgi:hypothetical protein